jgi:hypothetical protein
MSKELIVRRVVPERCIAGSMANTKKSWTDKAIKIVAFSRSKLGSQL